eukprot:SM000243S08585  [mRNA]  locus=s243:169086:171254:- [translate_table: standard]
MEAAADVHASWVVASGSLLQVVRVVAATSAELGGASDGARHGGAIDGGAAVRLRRPPDGGGACEVTVPVAVALTSMFLRKAGPSSYCPYYLACWDIVVTLGLLFMSATECETLACALALAGGTHGRSVLGSLAVFGPELDRIKDVGWRALTVGDCRFHVVAGGCSVQFMQRSLRVRRVCLVASARNCEIYGQQLPSSELEYVRTVRGSPASPGAEVSSTATSGQQRLYEAIVQLAEPAVVWASAFFKLLSLADKDEAVIASLVLEVSPGPAAGAALNSSSYLTPVEGPAPWMGLVMRGLAQAASRSSSSSMHAELPDFPETVAMKRGLESARDVRKSTGSPSLSYTFGAGGTSSEPSFLANASSPSPQPALEVPPQHTEQSRQGEAGVGIDETVDDHVKLLQSMASRLEHVEAACLRIESGFERMLRVFDERLRLLEDHFLGYSGNLDQPWTKTNGGPTLASQSGGTLP